MSSCSREFTLSDFDFDLPEALIAQHPSQRMLVFVASRYSDFKGQTTLYGGSLILEHNVVFGNAGLRDDTSMTLEHGTLEITGGSVINAASFSITNNDVVLRPGTSAFINAKNVDLSRGFVFDMQKQAQEAANAAQRVAGMAAAVEAATALVHDTARLARMQQQVGVLGAPGLDADVVRCRLPAQAFAAPWHPVPAEPAASSASDAHWRRDELHRAATACRRYDRPPTVAADSASAVALRLVEPESRYRRADYPL